ALWSLRKIMTGASEQLALNMPSGARLIAAFRLSWLRDNPCHLRLPSLLPMITCLATVTSDTADCTPARLLMRHSSWSMASMVSYAEHISGGVLTITTSTSELVE